MLKDPFFQIIYLVEIHPLVQMIECGKEGMRELTGTPTGSLPN